MVKFGQKYKTELVYEWKDQYLDYEGLKERIDYIERRKKRNNNITELCQKFENDKYILY
jgi:SPX domain protein involved in polyphosphate accumulation